MRKLLFVLLVVAMSCTKIVQEEKFCWKCRFIPEYPNVWAYEMDTCGVEISRIQEVIRGVEGEFEYQTGIPVFGSCLIR